MKSYTKEEIIDLVRAKLIEVYGGLSRDEDGKKISTPYMVLGILGHAIPDDKID